jgi:hypothetical protein
MADGNYLTTYLKVGVDYEFDIKLAKFNYTKLKTCGSYRNSLLTSYLCGFTICAPRSALTNKHLVD